MEKQLLTPLTPPMAIVAGGSQLNKALPVNLSRKCERSFFFNFERKQEGKSGFHLGSLVLIHEMMTMPLWFPSSSLGTRSAVYV